ncbi:MAG: hypothetical protein DMG09_23550 [Acidobacteria bacterium]|nr:MAG: hypothetical protein DMG09_23550 [Acidobacteriota bacterium]
MILRVFVVDFGAVLTTKARRIASLWLQLCCSVKLAFGTGDCERASVMLFPGVLYISNEARRFASAVLPRLLGLGCSLRRSGGERPERDFAPEERRELSQG